MAWGFMRTFFPETKKRRKAAKAKHNENEKMIKELFGSNNNTRKKPVNLNENFIILPPTGNLTANNAAANKRGNNEGNLTNNEIKAAAKKLENLFNKSGIPSKLNASRTRSRKRTLDENLRKMFVLHSVPKPRSI